MVSWNIHTQTHIDRQTDKHTYIYTHIQTHLPTSIARSSVAPKRSKPVPTSKNLILGLRVASALAPTLQRVAVPTLLHAGIALADEADVGLHQRHERTACLRQGEHGEAAGPSPARSCTCLLAYLPSYVPMYVRTDIFTESILVTLCGT